MATSLQTYKERYPNVYGNLSDVDVIYKMSELTGRDPQSLAEHFGMYDPSQGDFARGVSSGIDSLQGGLYGLAGYVGDVVGSDAVRDWGYQGYDKNMKEVGLRAKETDNIENAESVGDYVDAAQYWLGYAIPQIVEAVFVSKGTGAITKKAAERQVRKQLQKEYGGKLNKGALNAVMSSKKTQAKLAEVLPKATKKGEYSGLAGQAIGTELGYTYGGAVDEALAEGKTKEDVDLMKVTAYGGLAGVAEFAGEALTLGLAKVGPAKDLLKGGRFTSKSRTLNAAARGLGGGTIEAGTEVVQTGLEEMGAGKSFEEANFRDPTSAFAGFVGGGAMGTVGGALSKKTDPLAVIKDEAEKAEVNVENQRRQEDEDIKKKNEAAQKEIDAENAEAQRKIALRKTHSKTFLSEEELIEEARIEQELIDNLQLNTPGSELDTTFQEWLTNNRKYISKNEKANAKLKKDFLESLPKPKPEDNTAAYEAALDDHATLQETRAQRAQDPDFNPEANDFALEEFYQARKAAIAAGDLATLREVESEAERTSVAGEWLAYKREAAFQEAVALEQAKLDQKEKTTKKPEVVEVEKPNVSNIKTLDDIELKLSPQTTQVWDFIKRTVSDGTIGDYYTVAQTKGKGSNKAKGWATEKIRKEMGLKSKGNVSKAITRVKEAVDATYKQDFETILGSILSEQETKVVVPEVTEAEVGLIQENNTTGAPIDEDVASDPNTAGGDADILSNPGMNIIGSEGQTKLGKQKIITTKNVPGKNPVEKSLASLSEEERAKEEAKIAEAEEKEAKLAKQQAEKEGSAKLDKQGQKRRDEEHNKNLTDVATALFGSEFVGPSNKKGVKTDPKFVGPSSELAAVEIAKKQIATSWEETQEQNQPKFDDMSVKNRSEWALATAMALETGNDSGLQQARQDIIQNHIGEQSNESQRGNQTKTKKVSKTKSTTTKQTTKTGGDTNDPGKTGGAKIRKTTKPKSKVVKKAKLKNYAAQLKKDAATRLGKGWQAKHTELNKLLKAKNYKEFESTVLAIQKREKAFAAGDAAQKALKKNQEARRKGLKHHSKVEELHFQENKESIEAMFIRLVGPKQYEKIKDRIFIGRNNKDLAWQSNNSEKDLDSAIAFVQTYGSGKQPTINFNVEKMLEKAKQKEFGKNAFEAVFMHEVGSHIGLDRILSPRESQALAAKIRKWAEEYRQVKKEGGKPTMEQEAARYSMVSMGYLDATGSLKDNTRKSTASSNPNQMTSRELKETIAYFITHAVGAGAKPSHKNDIGKVLHKFRQAFRKFMGYLVSQKDNITGQDIINMAYGAAALELRAPDSATETTRTFMADSRNLTEDEENTIQFQNAVIEWERKQSRESRLEEGKLMVAANKLAFDSGMSEEEFKKVIKALALKKKKQDKEFTADFDSVINFNSNEFWDNKINEYVARILPKNDKNKYIAPKFLPVDEWREFQIKKGREEKRLRAELKAEAKRRREDAARHEQRLYDPDENTTDIEYEVSIPEKKHSREASEKARTWILNNFGSSAASIWDTFVDLFKKGVESTQFLHQLIRKFEKVMPSAKAWHKAILQLEKTRNEIKQVVDDIQVQARELGRKKLVVAEEFIKDSTERQLWAYNPYKTSDPRHEKIEVDGAMEKRFNKLDSDQQALVKAIFAHGEKMLTRKRLIAQMFFQGDDKELNKIGRRWFGVSGLEGPYAPLRRFGTHVVELKSDAYLKAEKAYEADGGQETREDLEAKKTNPLHYEVSFHPNMGAAKQYRDSRQAEFTFAEASAKTDVVNEGRSPDYKILDKVLANMGVEGLDKSSKEYQQIELMVKNMYFESLSEENARRSQQKRRTIPGAEKGMVRSFVVNATAEANLIANMEHGTAVNTALGNARKEMKKDRPKLGRIYNLLVSHYVSTLNEKPTPIQDRLAAVNTVYMLTSSIGYHITNATQPLMVTIPKLAGDFGATNYVRALKLYWKGLRMAKNIVTFDAKNLRFQTHIDITKAPAKYQALLTELQDRQLLDVGLEQDLAQFNRSDSGFKLVNKGSEAASTVAHRLYQVARMVEAYNRISTATAAYEMAQSKPHVVKNQGMDSAQDYAISVVEDTQGNFSAMDAPQILKGAPKLMGQYRKYQIMMAWVYADATKKSLWGATAYEKAAGKRTMAFMMGHAALFSGAVGVPVLGQIAPYLLGMLNEGDEPEDLERWIHENIGDETWATAISRGLPSLFGVDMSTKLSQQKIFHPAPYTDFSLTEDALVEGFFEVLMGPTAATASNFMRSISYAKEGNAWRATEYALPKGVRTLMESYRLATEGYSLRNGDIVGPDAFSGFQLAVNALGVPATDINNIKWTRGQQFELENWFSEEQSKIRKKYVEAKKDKDRKAARNAIDDWKDLQDAKDRVRPFFHNARSAIKRTALSSLMKAPARQRKREKNYKEQLGTN